MPTPNRRLLVVLSVVTLDSIGIGLVFPILPSLLRQLSGARDISVLYGVILALYAFMQFVFSPVLGALSDRYGRRPVLLTSIAGATIDYVIMSLTPVLWVLVAGRALAGLTSANLSVATAYLTDITEEAERAKRFGYMSACFGIGFIIGPVIGGVLGERWLHAPFVAAAVMNGVNLALVYFILPESRVARGGALRLATFNPIGPVRAALSIKPLVPLVGLFFVFGLVGNIPGTIWVLYGEDRFAWTGFMVGLSLATFGLCHALAQAFVTGPLTARFGELKTVVIGILFDSAGFVVISLASRGWIAFANSPVFALGGVGMPALQSMASNEVGESRQGELQGVLASIMSLTAIIGPLVGTAVYSSTRTVWIGAVWILGALLYLFAIPLLLTWRAHHRARLAAASAPRFTQA